jgi:endonuclease-3
MIFSYSTRQEWAMAVVEMLVKATTNMSKPMIDTVIEEYNKDPFRVLVACLLSLRSRDAQTIHVVRDVFALAKTPQEMSCLSIEVLERIIYPIGFYHQKAKTIQTVSREIIERFLGNVPDNEEDLLSIPGIGRKTATLVLSMAFDKPALCVDVHVHRISNRIGLVNTTNPHETEIELKKLLPQEYWRLCNRVFVQWGQSICLPVRPCCQSCVVNPICQKKWSKNKDA